MTPKNPVRVAFLAPCDKLRSLQYPVSGTVCASRAYIHMPLLILKWGQPVENLVFFFGSFYYS